MVNFSDMPAELRNMVYDSVFKPPVLSRTSRNTRNALAIFAASRQLHSEATSHFYENKEITVDPYSVPTNHATLLPPVADRYLRFLKHLTIHTMIGPSDLPSIRRVARTLAALTTTGAQMTKLNIVIVSPLSQLLSSRVDDSVMDANHPITQSIRTILECGVAESVTIDLLSTYFAPDVARALQTLSKNRLSFSVNGETTDDWSSIERSMCGRYSFSHLSNLGLIAEDIAGSQCDASSCTSSTPSSLPSSTASGFADLDQFSVTSFGMSADEELSEPIEESFFKEEDIEDWSAATQESASLFECEMDNNITNDVQIGSALDNDDEDDDDEMEDISTTDLDHILRNLNDTAHHIANDADITYMTNFAPDLLLSRHQLGHLR